MKRLMAMLLAALMVVSLAACSSNSSTTTTTAATTTAATTTTTAASTTKAESTTAAEKKNEDYTGTVVLYSSMTENDLDGLISGFNSWYPNVEVEVVNGTAGELTSRITAEAANPQGDVVWGALNQGDGMQNDGLFEYWLSDYEDEVIDAYKSDNGFYNYDHLSTVVFCVNTDLEAELGLNITGYADLLDEKLYGKIVFSDPNSSSAAWNNVANIMAVFGNDSDEAWSYMESLMANGLNISTSSSACFKNVMAGEYVVGITYEDGVSGLLKNGATNIKMVYPAEGASAFAFGTAVIKNAPHMELAKLLVNYLMNAQSQEERGNALGTIRYTNKNAVINYAWLPSDDEINWVERDCEWLRENKAQVLEHWNSLIVNYQH
jgi:iron(III) transport system substrate-binding protein